MEGKIEMEKWKERMRRIDALTEKTGRFFSYLFIPLMVFTALEVVLRYFFRSPTIWAWDVNIQIFGILIIFGGAYTYRTQGHVRVDLVISHVSRRTRAIMDLISSSWFFFSYSVLLIISSQEAWRSFMIREKASSIWAPPLYPLKILIPLAILLLLLQGVAHVIRNVLVIMHPEGEAK